MGINQLYEACTFIFCISDKGDRGCDWLVDFRRRGVALISAVVACLWLYLLASKPLGCLDCNRTRCIHETIRPPTLKFDRYSCCMCVCMWHYSILSIRDDDEGAVLRSDDVITDHRLSNVIFVSGALCRQYCQQTRFVNPCICPCSVRAICL